MVGNIPMLRVSVCSCSFRFYPPVGVSPCVWCRSVLCCDVLFVCAAGSVTLLTVVCCYTANWAIWFAVWSWYFHCIVADTATHFYRWLEYIAYCHSSTVSVLCYLLYVRTGFFLLCGRVLCTALNCHCLSDPSFSENVFQWSWFGIGHCSSDGWYW